MSEPFISLSPPLFLLCMGDDRELIKSKKPLKLGTWPRAIPFPVVVPDEVFFSVLFIASWFISDVQWLVNITFLCSQCSGSQCVVRIFSPMAKLLIPG